MSRYDPDPMGVKATQARQHRERMEREAKAQTRAAEAQAKSLRNMERMARDAQGGVSQAGYQAYGGGASSDSGAKTLEAMRYLDEALQRAKDGDLDGAVRAMTFSVTLEPMEETRDTLEMLKEWQRTGSKSQADALLQRRVAEREQRAAAGKAAAEREASRNALIGGIVFASIEFIITSAVAGSIFHSGLIGWLALIVLGLSLIYSRTHLAAQILVGLGWAALMVSIFIGFGWFSRQTYLLGVTATLLFVVIIDIALTFLPWAIRDGKFN